MFDEPKDMFEGADKAPALAPVPASYTPPPSNVPPLAALPAADEPHSSKWKTMLIVLLALVAFGVAGFLVYRMMIPTDVPIVPVPTGEDDANGDGTASEDDEEGKGETPTEEEEPEDIRPTIVDSDGDGLSNARELEVGTSVGKADTDADGLGDREEVEVYGTDPRRNDTDGDTFIDGEEVQAGYNPNGPGRLLEVPEAN